ncbi:ferritin-like domain-containing protein [Hymenobacter setariae]|uniref:Ferritin-like domain-containing protein n=1 Tax=Hymenobacter setariae TaxID=2594794 RepID=A0A558BVD7_9BACT|nr:ferritin-like domain-containing protein [Hymenobacter setariae]TVT40486.1 ferritin-like domain-containing protein [Hymenobacter setariae]
MSHNVSPGSQPHETGLDRPLYTPIKRRSFFMYAGATAGATALLLAGCKDDDNNSPNATDVGAGDTGVLNYAYALEQLEAAFYAQVLTSPYFTNSSTTAAEKQIFTDLALHEKIHADFFKAALGSAAIKALTPDFSKIDFATRAGVLAAAQAFEDLGVQAYNGAGRYITDVEYLGLAGKIVSVEARHAALIRDLITYNSFVGPLSGTTVSSSDVIDPNTGAAVTTANSTTSSVTTFRTERSKLPSVVLATANTFLADGSKISANSFG